MQWGVPGFSDIVFRSYAGEFEAVILGNVSVNDTGDWTSWPRLPFQSDVPAVLHPPS